MRALALLYWRHTSYMHSRTILAASLGLVIGSLFSTVPLTSAVRPSSTSEVVALTSAAFVWTVLIFGPTSSGAPVVGFASNILHNMIGRERRKGNFHASTYAISISLLPVRS